MNEISGFTWHRAANFQGDAFTCDSCGALVPRGDSMDKHRNFHKLINVVISVGAPV